MQLLEAARSMGSVSRILSSLAFPPWGLGLSVHSWGFWLPQARCQHREDEELAESHTVNIRYQGSGLARGVLHREGTGHGYHQETFWVYWSISQFPTDDSGPTHTVSPKHAPGL